MYYLGIDLGGTNIKAGIVTEDCKIIISDSRPTGLPCSAEEVCGNIADIAMSLLSRGGISLREIGSVGVGCPGNVNGSAGIVKYAYNLGFRDVPLKALVESKMGGIPVFIGNDANLAAFGEYRAGSAKGAQSSVLITLGTGLGAGIVIDSKIIEGFTGAASEFGHMVIEKGGTECTCGRRGCWEAYSSATGLIAMSRAEMKKNPESLMVELSRAEGRVSGRTAFAAMKAGDLPGKSVVDRYISYLACGIANVISALQPEVISLGGGVSREGDPLLLPLIEAVRAETFGGPDELVTEIRLCELGNDAGIIGAAMLGEQKMPLGKQ